MNNAVDGLSVEGVHVWRGERHVLKGLSLELKPHDLLHISGPNGTGKTTLLRVVSGLLRPEQGNVSWLGKPISSVRSEYQCALAYASHEPALKGDLTALENLKFMVGLRRRVAVSELRANLDRTGVAACADLPVRVTGTVTHSSMHGSIGSGGEELRLHTSGGSIHIRAL